MNKKYPECEKLHAVHEESQKIGDFLEFLREQDYTLCKFQNEEYNEDIEDYYPAGFYPTYERTDDLLAKYFGIDLDKVEDERRQILEELRKANGELD